MARNGWDTVVVSGSDPHSSEYPAPRWQQVKWLNAYNARVYETLAPLLPEDVALWLRSKTLPL
ncbi:MAG: M24 family metallopeptidase C-terminal domain-containing protein [Bacteroidales bacterium]|nr:M24 family metallopeptidase C-terminal domain-containing protein [Bacteroidales bacterium]